MTEKVKLTRRLAGIPMEKAAGSNTSVHVGCWTREYESLFQRDHELQAKYLATGTGNASEYTGSRVKVRKVFH